MAMLASPPPSLSPDVPVPKQIIPRRAPQSMMPTAQSLVPASTAAPTTTGSTVSIPATTASLTTATTAASSASPPEIDESSGTGSTSVATAGDVPAALSSATAWGLRSSRTQPNTAAASSTSLAAMAVAAPQGTPLTGVGKMAAAAAAKKRGDESAGGTQKPTDEDHPLSDHSLGARGYHTLQAMQHLFHVPDRWRLLRPLGQGAYGLVISVQDELSGEPVAVKCITRVFDKPILARRALREITLLRHFGEHENLTGLIDLDNVWDGYNEVYLYMEPMEADLHQIVRSGQPLSNLHIQFFLYQLLRGMKYIHSANVIHRDLKPGNLLVNSDCELKICDFGLARGFNPVPGEAGQNDLKMTEYVATRWYRAPEIMLSNRRYTTAIDVWSIGCILGELLGGKPMFKGKDYVDQLNLILGVLGTPDDQTLERLSSEKARMYVKTLPPVEGTPFEEIFPQAGADAVDLLRKLLAFDPAERIDVATALQHPYVSAYHDPADEPECPVFDKWDEVERLETTEQLREALTREITEYRAEVRGLGDESEYGEDIGQQEELDDDEDDYVYTASSSRLASSRNSLELLSESVDSSSIASIASRTTSPDRMRSALGVAAAAGRSPTLSPRISRPGLPRPPTDANGGREASPAPRTAMSGISEASFGHSATMGRSSRRSSSHTIGPRRSMSFLFGGGSGFGMTSLSMTSASGPPARDNAVTTGSSGGEFTAGSVAGRRSRAPSSSIADLRPLIRQLSTANISELRDQGRPDTDDEPLITHSASDGPITMSRRSSASASRRSSAVRRGRSDSIASVCIGALGIGSKPAADDAPSTGPTGSAAASPAQ